MTPVSTCTVDQPGKLFLPAPNFYIPRYLLAENYCNRVPLTSNPYKDGNIYFNPPTCLYNAAGGAGKCWWSEDLLFLQPRSAIYVLFEGQFDWSEDFLESEMNALAERLFNQLTASKSYPSLIAGLHQSLSWSHKYSIPLLL